MHKLRRDEAVKSLWEDYQALFPVIHYIVQGIPTAPPKEACS